MHISYDESKQLFHLTNDTISYVIAIEDDQYLTHHYWGKKLEQISSKADYPLRDRSFEANPSHVSNRNFSLGTLLLEYSGSDSGDFRESAYSYADEEGRHANQLLYKGYRIYEGKKALKGLPATYVTEDNQAKTLEIDVYDEYTGMKGTLQYTIFDDLSVITRSVNFNNTKDTSLVLKKALSMSVDFPDSEYDLIQLPGAWGRERDLVRSPLTRGVHKMDSKRGTTSHTYQPFLALAKDNTTEHEGEVYGIHLVYSGEFVANVEVDAYAQTRMQMGINPEHFEWELEPGATFQTPEVAMVYSDSGLNGMSHTYHQLYQHHLIRGTHQHKERPVLINNWEGTYFDFDDNKILDIAENASDLGVELFVLDDGWFGNRDNDLSSLGDWYVNKTKLKNGLKTLSESIHAKGMKFGLWFEPEMISEDSDLFRDNPDWAIHTEGRGKSLGRSQLVLDFSRKEVRENILKQMKAILDEVPIDYIKWDYNRNMTELNSAGSDSRWGEVAHRYILGLYEVLEELNASYPEILFESCSGGGGRYDPGMLYYMPQTWTSDNTDAVARLEIQTGTSLVMPVSSMGSHVSAVPNHQVDRYTSLEMRGDVAMSGNLGYELDVTTLSVEEQNEVKSQIEFYKNYRQLIQFGTFSRILSPFDGKQKTSWIFVDESKDNAVFMYFQILDKANKPNTRIKLVGLDPVKQYKLDDERIIGGDELMYRGLYIDPDLYGDFTSRRIVIKSV